MHNVIRVHSWWTGAISGCESGAAGGKSAKRIQYGSVSIAGATNVAFEQKDHGKLRNGKFDQRSKFIATTGGVTYC